MIALQAEGEPRSRFYEVAHRIAGGAESLFGAAFLAAVAALRATIDEVRLVSAILSGELPVIEAAAGAGRIASIMGNSGALESAVFRTAVSTGTAAAQVVSDATGLGFAFDVVRPDVVLAARDQTARLVVAIDDDVRETIRIVVARGAAQGVPPERQARVIRMVVGLRPSHTEAPSRLAGEIRDGHAAAATRRRLSATDKAQIRSRIARGTVNEEFIAEMETRYTRSLLNRRALDIARTESLRASHIGQRDAWRQAVSEGVLPSDVRRVAVVTPDDRLRETHAMVPGMNPEGVGLEEPFDTPFGPLLGPPWEPLCRCGEGLVFPGQVGVL